MENNLKKKAFSGVLWTFGQQFSTQIINFVVQVILARLLMPADFGLIAMITVFINLGQMLLDSGMTTSLIRTKNPDDLDYSTVFLTNVIISICVYIIIFFSAPFIADFYSQPNLQNILRVYSLSFIVRAFVAVHLAKLTKEMNFKTQMRLQIPSTFIGATIGVGMAYSGWGVWSLVGLNICQATTFAIQCWLFLKWRPSLVFNKRRFKYHFNFGYKMTLSGILDSVYNDSYRIIIGKFYSPTSVGFFNQAETMRLFPVNQLGTVMGKVTYSWFSNIKNDIELKAAYKETIRIVFFIVVPMMMVLIVVGEEFFIVLFGEKWLPAVPYFQILSFASIIKPLTSYNLNILKVKGRSDLFLKLEIYKKIIGVIAIVIALPYGIMVLVVTYTIVYHLMNFLNMFYSGRLINYSVLEQIKDCYRIYLSGVFCMGLTYLLRRFYFIQFLDLNDFTILICVVLVFFTVYIFIIYLLDKKTFKTIYNLKKVF